MSTKAQYVLKETLISMIINALLSIGFVYLIFHGQSHVAVTGIVVDMAPQTFMVVIMSCLVPGLLTRKRLSGGELSWHSQSSSSVLSRIWLRAVVFALAATCFVVMASWAVLPRLIPLGVSFVHLLAGKALFGMLMASLATVWAISRVLREDAL